MKTNGLSNETIRVLATSLDEQIEQAKNRLAELHQARKELQGNLTDGPNGSKPPIRRLPPGLPETLVCETLQKHDRLTIGEIIYNVFNDRGFKIRDGSTRRALKKLIREEKVERGEDGTYRWINIPF